MIANCAAVNTPLAVEYARYAAEVGADAVIAMPPYVIRPDFESVRDYYRAISEEAGMPVWIQNAGVAALSAGDIARLCTEIEHVSWVKEEVPPSHRSIAALNAQNCTAVEGIMGGDGGRAMMIEHALGTRGVLHACQFCDLVQKAWELLDAGETGKAGDLYEVLLPGLYAEGLMGMAFAKEIMVRRGVFWNHRIRGQANPLSGPDMKAIDRIWNRIEPHLIWRQG